MAAVNLTEPEFADVVDNNEIVLLDFWAEWCGPCKAYGPVYERVSEDFPDVVFGKIDTEAEPQLAQAFNIRSIPTTIAFKEGIGVFMQPGALPEDALRDLVTKLGGLDMDFSIFCRRDERQPGVIQGTNVFKNHSWQG